MKRNAITRWLQRPEQTLSYTQSPLLAARTPLWRSRLLVALVGLGFAGLLGRTLYIQALATDFFQQQGRARSVQRVELPASRGSISDRSGQLLATSIAVPAFWANPSELEADPARRAALARVMGLDMAELQRRLDSADRFVWLLRSASDEQVAQLQALKLRGVYQERAYQRRYPQGEALAHVVGFTDLQQQGQEGVELAFQQQLQGHAGSRAVIHDRLGRAVEDLGERRPAVNGQDLQLSIDATLQALAFQRIKGAVLANAAKAGSVVVLDTLSGEVLALANYPSYRPDERGSLSGAQLRNRALTDVFEPGSTMKPFTVAQALERGSVKPDTVIDVAPGRMTISGATISDAHPASQLSVAQVIQKSSNIGTVKMALQMPPRELHDMFRAIGLGQRPELPFPGAISGRLRPYKNWRPIEQATMSYGYGLSASLFQLAQAYTVFARDGERIPVSLLKREGSAPVNGTRVFSPATARTMRQMLQTVTQPGGTSPQAQVQGYSVGGKSGTAYKQEGQGYNKSKYRAWFVGLAPIKQPRLVVAVMLDEPSAQFHDGGRVAAPVFSSVVGESLRLLHVAPDLDVKAQIQAAAERPLVDSLARLSLSESSCQGLTC